MNYRHAFHAGNFADVFKHAILLALLDALTAKDKPLCHFDTHAGRGRYALDEAEAAKTGEWRDGIGRLFDSSEPPTPLRHYVEAVRDNQHLDLQFKSLLKHHWLEESQHAKLDTLIVEELAANATDKEIDQALQEYAGIGAFIDNGIQQQTEFNVEAFIAATGKTLAKRERREMTDAVLKGMRWTYLGTGMTHPNFLATVETIRPEARQQIEAMAPAYC